jgi:hypothetical protein
VDTENANAAATLNVATVQSIPTTHVLRCLFWGRRLLLNRSQPEPGSDLGTPTAQAGRIHRHHGGGRLMVAPVVAMPGHGMLPSPFAKKPPTTLAGRRSSPATSTPPQRMPVGNVVADQGWPLSSRLVGNCRGGLASCLEALPFAVMPSAVPVICARTSSRCRRAAVTPAGRTAARRAVPAGRPDPVRAECIPRQLIPEPEDGVCEARCDSVSRLPGPQQVGGAQGYLGGLRFGALDCPGGLPLLPKVPLAVVGGWGTAVSAGTGTGSTTPGWIMTGSDATALGSLGD